jgi:hypothetical protein
MAESAIPVELIPPYRWACAAVRDDAGGWHWSHAWFVVDARDKLVLSDRGEPIRKYAPAPIGPVPRDYVR